MSKLVILGSSHAIPDESHDNTHLALIADQRLILIDTGNNPIVRLKQAGLDVLALTDLIVTHFHPDHVAGIPMLLLGSWLLGRERPLDIYGLAFTLERLQKMMDLFGWDEWPHFFQVNLHIIPDQEQAVILNTSKLIITASPVHHMLPNIGLRVDLPSSGESLVYSGDTEPCEEIVRLAAGVNVLLHEASGDGFGHSSAAQAGEIARKAEVNRLYLIHYDPMDQDPDQLIREARTTFNGSVMLASDLMEISFPDEKV